MWRAEPSQGWDEPNVTVVGQSANDLLGLLRTIDDAQAVAQPMDCGAGDKD
jgi:hypothetical protein